jgi:hypothetical protein
MKDILNRIKSCENEQTKNIKNIGLRSLMIEAKVLVDRNSLVTEMFLLNPRFNNDIRQLSDVKECTFSDENNTGFSIWGADIIVNDAIPENEMYAISTLSNSNEAIGKVVVD